MHIQCVGCGDIFYLEGEAPSDLLHLKNEKFCGTFTKLREPSDEPCHDCTTGTGESDPGHIWQTWYSYSRKVWLCQGCYSARGVR